MRRGLMGWNAEELPPGTLDDRVARLQAAMQHGGFDALVLYSNLVRPSAVCWLTGFTPYWIESLLLVGREGAPLLATALSKRVSDWIRTTSHLGEIINTPKPGTAIGQRLATAGSKRVGVVELDALPAGLYDDIIAVSPSSELTDATALFAAERRHLDAAERKLIESSAKVAVTRRVTGLNKRLMRANYMRDRPGRTASDLRLGRLVRPVPPRGSGRRAGYRGGRLDGHP